jgi:hypothetical protein
MGKTLMPMSEKTNGNNHKELLSQPLPQTVRHEFEAKFGQDFSNVRVHEPKRSRREMIFTLRRASIIRTTNRDRNFWRTN